MLQKRDCDCRFSRTMTLPKMLRKMAIVSFFGFNFTTSFTVNLRTNTINRNNQPASAITLQSQNKKCTTTISTSTVLFASTIQQVSKQFNLDDKFGRWRFLQNYLDDSLVDDSYGEAINRMIYWTLDGYLKYPRPKFEGTDVSDALEMTNERETKIQNLLQQHTINDSLMLYKDGKADSIDIDLLQKLQEILPDPVLDEDDHKSTWDVILEIHGREATRIDEQSGSIEWQARCTVARLLLAYDFLTYGLLDAPIKQD